MAFELVDADSQALLDSLAAQTTRAKPDVEPPQSQFGFAAGEIRRGSVKVLPHNPEMIVSQPRCTCNLMAINVHMAVFVPRENEFLVHWLHQSR